MSMGLCVVVVCGLFCDWVAAVNTRERAFFA